MNSRQYFVCALAALFLLPLSWNARAQFSPERRAYVESIAVPDHPDRVYSVGQVATLRLEAYAAGVPLDGVWVRYKSGDELMEPHTIDSMQFRGGVALLPIGTRMEPGFKTISYEFAVAGKQYKDYVNVGFSPEKIRTFTPDPEDFDEFWAKTISEAQAVPLDPVVTPLPQYSTETVEVSKVKLTVGPGGRNIYAYLSRPKDGRKHPVLFGPPGAGKGTQAVGCIVCTEVLERRQQGFVGGAHLARLYILPGYEIVFVVEDEVARGATLTHEE